MRGAATTPAQGTFYKKFLGNPQKFQVREKGFTTHKRFAVRKGRCFFPKAPPFCPEFFTDFCTDIGQYPNDLAMRHGISLVEISRCRSQFPIRTAKLTDNDLGVQRIRIFDLDRVLQFLFVCPHGLVCLLFPRPRFFNPVPIAVACIAVNIERSE